MPDIHVQPTTDHLVLNFQFNSPQQFFYNIILYNRDRSQMLARINGQSSGQTQFDLGEADDLIGIYLLIDWAVIDPSGAGSAYLANAIVTQNGNPCLAPQSCAGTTTDTASFCATFGKFVTP